jgi:hypothetical protein
VLTDDSRYNWQLRESRCIGTIRRTQTFTRVVEHGAAEVVATPEAACRPRSADRVVLRPREVVIEPGGRACFQAKVVDSAGCRLRDAPIELERRGSSAVRGRLRGLCFRAADSAAESEGELEVAAVSGNLSATATVLVRTADLSGLIARPQSSAPVGDHEAVAEAQSAAGVAARASEPGLAVHWPIIIASFTLLLVALILALIVALRRPPATAPQPAIAPPPQPQAHSPEPIVEPVPGPTAAAPEPEPPSSPLAGSAMICPTCRRGFSAATLRCPKDSDELLPYEEFAKRHKQAQGAGQTKICPKCGDSYGVAVSFCGKDGSELVLVN